MYSLVTIAPGVSLPEYAKTTIGHNLKLLSIDLFQLGYRSKLMENFHLELDLFLSAGAKLYLSCRSANSWHYGNGKITIISSNRGEYSDEDNAEIWISTPSLNYAKNKIPRWSLFTVQSTKLTHIPQHRNSTTADSVQNITVTYNANHTGTPFRFGGAYAKPCNQQEIPNLNVSM